MILGSLIDAGLEFGRLQSALGKLPLGHYDIRVQRVKKHGLGGMLVDVVVEEDHHHHHHRHLGDISDIIDRSGLSQEIKEKSLRIFNRLAEAEAKVHQTTVDHIHFHEVGAVDAIVDVVGSVAGLELMGIEKIFCSPLHLGTGTVECAHGTLPVPAPATAELVKGKPVYSTGVTGELLTPTGAAVLTTLAAEFGPMPAMTIETIGYGAGTAEPAIPNLLRLITGSTSEEKAEWEMEQVVVLETNIDDMNPQIYDYLIEKALALNALDIYLTPVQMKKNRGGTLLSIVCEPANQQRFSNFLMRETTTIGLRWRLENRIKAHRTIDTLETPYGLVRCKVAAIGNEKVNVMPEYEDCKKIAVEKKLSLKQLMQHVQAAIQAKYGIERP